MIHELPEALIADAQLHRIRHEFPKARQERLFELLAIGRTCRRWQDSRPAGETKPDNALLAQHTVGVAYRVQVDRQRLSQLADTGQLVAWLKLTAAELLLDGGGNLQVDGSRVVLVY